MARTRREAGAAIQASAVRLRGMLEEAGERFALLDSSFRILEINAERPRFKQRPPQACSAWPTGKLILTLKSQTCGASERAT